MDLFDKCMEVIFKHEGGYVNDPDDWGGETRYGIAKRYFPDEDIKALTKERARQLYFADYWLPMNLTRICNELSILHIFDFGVNAGKSRSIKTAQRLCMVKEDGILGPMTTHAINNYDGHFSKDFAHARRVYYEYIATKRNNIKFLKGWLNRVDSTHFEIKT